MPYMKLYESNPLLALDITPMIEEFNWSENDLDGPDAGRALDGIMYRGKVASKRRCDIKLVTLPASSINSIFEILRNEYFYCETDLVPATGALTMEMYNSTRSGGISIIDTDNVVKHKDAKFNIIQR